MIYSAVHVNLFLKEKTYLTRPKYAITTSFFLITGYSPRPCKFTLTVRAEESKPKGWALKVMKKAICFNEKQILNNFEEKFFLGQETGYKVEAVTVAQEMKYAKDESGNRRF